MKQIASTILTIFSILLFSPVFAANTATNIYDVQQRVYGIGPVHYYNIAIDTTGQDLTIRTPQAGNSVCIVGMYMDETSATNLTFKSGSTTMVIPELPASTLIWGLSSITPLCTDEDAALKIQASVAITSILLQVVEGKHFNITAF